MSEQRSIPPQTQRSMPAHEYKMDPAPDWRPRHPGVGKLDGKCAIITGGDSGIGRAVAVLFAREGAKIGIIHLGEDRDAEDTHRAVEEEGSVAYCVKADIGRRDEAFAAVKELAEKLGGVDILVNNAAQQYEETDLREISEEQTQAQTFEQQRDGVFLASSHT